MSAADQPLCEWMYTAINAAVSSQNQSPELLGFLGWFMLIAPPSL